MGIKLHQRHLKYEESCRATIAQVRQHRWVAQDYKPCRSLQSVASTELSEYIFEENVQPQEISQVWRCVCHVRCNFDMKHAC